MTAGAKIIITVDTEVGEGAKSVIDGFEKLVMGRIGGEDYGAPMILDRLEEYGFKGEFFVDVYEQRVFGEEKYKGLCRVIEKRGHGVQLHTHPGYAYDGQRINMRDYSLEEQNAIIADGKELIRRWVGKEPIAHRAGNYGANNDTLRALGSNGIAIDSSYYHHNKNCLISLPTMNEPVSYEGVLEVPVTVIGVGPRIMGWTIPITTGFSKLDINMLGRDELKASIRSLSARCTYMVLFLHSFSFIKRDYPKYTFFEKDPATLKKFTDILRFVKGSGCEVISFEDVKTLSASELGA